MQGNIHERGLKQSVDWTLVLYYVLLVLIETVLAIMLLFDPVEHFTFHVRILGIEIILSVLQWLGLFKRFAPKK